jgi:phosphohistidine swiveling domain-containing protein
MGKLFADTDKYADGEGPPVVEAFHSALKDLVRRRLSESGGHWSDFVFGKGYSLIGPADIAEIERKVLASGYRYTCSAMISLAERPDAYKALPGAGTDTANFSFEHPDAVAGTPDASGRAQCGQGDNVVQFPKNVGGIARYFRSAAQVMQSLTDGVAPDTIAIIDDSGGTLTAPILERFKGVICAGGTTRSHLGILTREYGIPCVMNAKVSGIHDGDRVELEVSGPAKTTEEYQRGVENTVRVWKLGA